MNKEQKENWIKCWLQKFGNRDNETFYTKVTDKEMTMWDISLQYNYDFDGRQVNPYDLCCNGFKTIYQISDYTEEVLDDIINQLKTKQTVY